MCFHSIFHSSSEYLDNVFLIEHLVRIFTLEKLNFEKMVNVRQGHEKFLNFLQTDN